MKPRGGEGQNGRLKCPLGFLVPVEFRRNSGWLDGIKKLKERVFNMADVFYKPIYLMRIPTIRKLLTNKMPSTQTIDN